MADTPEFRIIPAAVRDKQEVDESIVGILERFLEQARRGELRWVGLIAVDSDDMARWSTSASAMKEHEVVGRIEQLKFLFLHPQH